MQLIDPSGAVRKALTSIILLSASFILTIAAIAVYYTI